MNLARLGNKYLADTEPWKTYKENEKRTETIINTSIQIAASLAILSKPFMPFTSKKLKNLLNINNVSWSDANDSVIKSDHKINSAIHLFNKIEDDKIKSQLNKLNESSIN